MSKKRKEPNRIEASIDSMVVDNATGATTDGTVSAEVGTGYQIKTTGKEVLDSRAVIAEGTSKTTTSVTDQKTELRQTTAKEKRADSEPVSDQEYDSTRPRLIRIKARIINEPNDN